ncbi:MAG: OmpA family protein [Deltaproteobacteria bacterium]|nr:OmpA family protein [Deltaproteobacteria bacterium]
MKSLVMLAALGGIAAAEPAPNPDFVPAKAPSTVVTEPASGARSAIEPTEIVMFDLNSATLYDASLDQVERVAAWLKRHPGYNLAIEGHTDKLGTPGYNNDLAMTRAAAVQSRLNAHGIPNDRLVLVGFGENGASATENHNDRRVVMYATKLNGSQLAAMDVRRGALRATWFERGTAFDMVGKQ